MIVAIIKFLFTNPELVRGAVEVAKTASKSRDPQAVMRRVQAEALALSLEYGYAEPGKDGRR